MSCPNVRRYIALTLSHVERRNRTPESVIHRVKERFTCTAIIVATEQHEQEGVHYHVAIKNEF